MAKKEDSKESGWIIEDPIFLVARLATYGFVLLLAIVAYMILK